MLSTFLRFITTVLLILTCMVAEAQSPSMGMIKDDNGLVARNVPDMPSYVLVVDDGCEVSTYHVPDSLFNSIAGRTIFKVNRTEINLEDPFLHELVDSVLPYANKEGWMLVGIDLRGAASPEGPYANNQRLSHGRSRALIKLMSTRLDSVLVNEAAITLVAEDYAHLLWLMEQAGDDDAPAVASIIGRHGLDQPQAIKQDLRKYGKGQLWKRLLAEYFPMLRTARVVLFFRRIYPERPKYPLIPPDAGHRLYVPMSDTWGLAPVDIPVTEAPLPVESPERRHMLSVGSNLLYDAFYMPQYGWAPMPNVQLEWYPPSGNFSFALSFMSPYYHRWSKHKFFQIRDYHFEVRHYFRPGERHHGLYLGAYVNNNIYGIGLSATKGWEGEGCGGALKIGYVLPLGRRWRMDLHLAVGGYITRYDPYVYGNPITGEVDGDYYYDYTGNKQDFVRRNHRFTWLGPTEAGFTITYDILFYNHNQSTR